VGRQRAKVREKDQKIAARAKVVAAEAFEAGFSPDEIAALTGYQPTTVARWEIKVERAQRRGLLDELVARWRSWSRGERPA